MDRRGFFKIVSTVSAGVATNSCGKKSDVLIPLLVSDKDIVPGEEQWRPAICSQCDAGCGTIVRLMEGERTIERNGEKFRERIACVKKIEGNPLDPVSGGRLCARGHAALQSLYNPDRIQGPLKRNGARGAGSFTSASWDEAIAAAAGAIQKTRSSDPSQILFLTRAQNGSRSATIQNFLKAIGAPGPQSCSLSNHSIENHAAENIFGWRGLPLFDISRAGYVLGVGADFLGGWTSPVYYARQFGQFRQGRPGIRGTFVQAESRMSTTAASADEWIPLRPGSELHFILAIARILLDDKLARNETGLPAQVHASILNANLADWIRDSGVDEKRLRRVARQLGEAEAPLLIAGASVVHTNSLQAVSAGYYINLLLGNAGKPGGMLPPNTETTSGQDARALGQALNRSKVLLLDDENPVYTMPRESGISKALANQELIISFGPFIDDSAAYADFILPDHHALESGSAVVPLVSPKPAITAATPFVTPLYNTRKIEDTLSSIATKMQVSFEASCPESFTKPHLPADRTWEEVSREGGLWLDANPPTNVAKPADTRPEWSGANFAGPADRYPLQFQPYLSLQYHDGRGANLPWMQELPDPASSWMWDLPVEIDAQTAANLNVNTGDRVRLESEHGSLEAPAYVAPAAIPGVVSMAIGQGHLHYGRYASERGANPLSIVAPQWEPATGALAFGGTRVRVSRVASGTRDLPQFSPRDREQGPWGYR